MRRTKSQIKKRFFVSFGVATFRRKAFDRKTFDRLSADIPPVVWLTGILLTVIWPTGI